MSVTNDQLKVFTDGVFLKHAVSNPDVLSIGELYEFFCNFFSGQNVTLADVQKTLLVVKTESSEKITRKEMYGILKVLVGRRREAMKERERNRTEGGEELGNKVRREKSRPQKENKTERGVGGNAVGGAGGQNGKQNVKEGNKVGSAINGQNMVHIR